MSSDPTVFVVGDDPSDLIHLTHLIEKSDLRVKTFRSAETFLKDYDPEQPGCVVVHVRAPGRLGLELQQRLIELGHSVPLIMVSVGSDVAMVVRAMKAGAVSVLEMPVEPKVMADTTREALAKDLDARQASARAAEVRRRLASLTPRERQVLDLLVLGKANKEVAANLDLSEKTVEIHRAHVLRKLQAPNVAALVRLVLLNGMHSGVATREVWRSNHSNGPNVP